MRKEMWKDMKGYEGHYQISNLGRVKSLGRKVWNGRAFYNIKDKILKPQGGNGKGRVVIGLCHLGKSKKEYITELVAEAFVLNKNNYTKINHIDKDETNNAAYNLKWSDNVDCIPNEIWVDVADYEGSYMVSSFGRVKSLDRTIWSDGVPKKINGKILVNRIGHYGYYRIGLYKDGNSKTVRVHRLTAQAFISNHENKPQINHINGDKTDNRVENLEWCTAKENTIHAYDTGLNTKITPVVGVNLKTREIVTFNRMMDALRYLQKNVNPKASIGSIFGCCVGYKGAKSAYGYKWEYQDKDKINKKKENV